MLRRNHIVQVKPQRLLKNMPLGLPIPFGKRNELILKAGRRSQE